jgi:hypothetical protein
MVLYKDKFDKHLEIELVAEKCGQAMRLMPPKGLKAMLKV